MQARPQKTAGETRILWAGFLQQIGRQDLLRSLALARRVRERRQDVQFTFCLKPECYSDEFKAYEAQGVEIYPGGHSFLNQLQSFDAFLSPVSAVESTPAPPLTWLEAMAAGVPIITTAHPGVDEVIEDGTSGLVAADYEVLEERLLDPQLGSKLQAMRHGARNQHSRMYEIESVAARYAAVYHQLLSEQR
jgi:glycosyltransferase involved in cell wall biosynthesis